MSTLTQSNTQTEEQIEEPPFYHVVFHNDDFTTCEFVVAVLMRFFYLNEQDAVRVMSQVHHHGSGIAGTYPLDIAQSKAKKVMTLAEQYGYPLQLTVEEALREAL